MTLFLRLSAESTLAAGWTELAVAGLNIHANMNNGAISLGKMKELYSTLLHATQPWVFFRTEFEVSFNEHRS